MKAPTAMESTKSPLLSSENIALGRAAPETVDTSIPESPSITSNTNATTSSLLRETNESPSKSQSNETNDDNQSTSKIEQRKSSNSQQMKTCQLQAEDVTEIPNPTSPQHLHDLIKSSRDKLFFISFSLQGKSEIVKLKSTPTKNEWYLVRVDLNICQSIEETKNCRETGVYYVDFYSKASYDKGILMPGGDSKKVAAEVMPDSHSRWWLEWHEFQFRRGEMVLGKAKEFDPNGGKAISERLMQLVKDENNNSDDNDDVCDEAESTDDDLVEQHPFSPEFHPNLDKYTTWADTLNLMDENVRLLGPFDFEDAKPTDVTSSMTEFSNIQLGLSNEVIEAVLCDRYSELYVRDRVPLQHWGQLLQVIKERGLDVTYPTVGWNKKRRCGTCAECTKPDCDKCKICLNKIQMMKEGTPRKGNKYGCKRRGRCLKMDDAASGAANASKSAEDLYSPSDNVVLSSIANTSASQEGFDKKEISTGEKENSSLVSKELLPEEIKTTPNSARLHHTAEDSNIHNISAFEEGGFLICHNCGRGDTESNPTLSFPDTRTKPSLHIHKSCAQTQNRTIHKEDFLDLMERAMSGTRRASLKGEGDFFLLDELKAKLYQTLESYSHIESVDKSLYNANAKEKSCSVSEVVAEKPDFSTKEKDGNVNHTINPFKEPLIGLPLSDSNVEDLDSIPIVYAYYSQDDDPSGISEENAKVAQLDFEIELKKQKRNIINVEGNGEKSPISASAGNKRRRMKNPATPNPTLKGEIAIKYNFPTGEPLAEFPTQPAVDFPEGWITRTIPRPKGEKTDTYYFSPILGFKFRSKPEVRRFLAELSECGGDEGKAVLAFKRK